MTTCIYYRVNKHLGGEMGYLVDNDITEGGNMCKGCVNMLLFNLY